ncbi:immunity protein Imm33 domain-containing protein [Variovorax sp. JS1663]|uniref:immunity protein Imm33 domain-containing protein n=1 Tax=Variovorax sp. JS1663 TaxID=1851577 RepID=UPI00117EE3F6|nr:hypothetical protein [Variovorax sp. JS1663]
MKIDILDSPDRLTKTTKGLASHDPGYEISASVSSPELGEHCEEFVRFIAEYVLSGNSIRAGETLAYGYWLTKAELTDGRTLVFFEYNPEATEFVFGVTHTLTYWRDQTSLCNREGADFIPPRPDQMVVISDGVYEGDNVEGVRYASPSHMSGWWLTTDRYNGKIESLKTVHAHHVSAKRPDLAKFLALPNGYRFFSPTGAVWFDEKAAK